MTTSKPFPGCIAQYDPNALPVGAAQEIVRQWAAPRGQAASFERVSLFDALDRVLAEDVVSPIDVPSHDNSAMDGYAFAGACLGGAREVDLKVVGTALAGQPFLDTPSVAQCVRIMTGALIPPGCDTVVPQELVTREGDAIRFAAGAVQPGQNRRLAGEDLAKDRPALAAGRIMRASDLGLLASLGIAEVAVRRRLRIAFFSTGDELRSVGETLTPGSIYDSNRYTLYAMLRRLNVEPIDLGVVRDDRASLEKALRHATETADVVISSGGVSVGDADFTRELMNSLGDVAFWKIAMRPGRPLAFGRLWSGPRAGEGESALFFGLPGNPVAVMATFYFIVREALLAMSGATREPLPLIQAVSPQPIRKRAGRTEFQRGIARRDDDGRFVVVTTGPQGSGVLSSMSNANCFIVLEHDRGDVDAGETVDILPFAGLI
ncbi:molybdopterin biosynthesis protein [Caballeronia arationis]|jgi:molybdopterin molybdotransferase|uniref:Molybdopterin molybdenumtransferase n=1 Tax=Caballeronia arationis TaxID=1777142 RepID=A0A7Z7I8V1_9BURK|nr:gephyrin-like molybdotransferase Glp [Caballeronia arationis]SAK55819.1 molybdopterin biosynthesis protein [Caballeronia arationis]SOE81052.1 molybdopterin molybdochelatase [Caballeronia arationis]